MFSLFLAVACGLLGYLIANYTPKATHAQFLDAEGNPEAIRTLLAASRLCKSQADLNYGNALVDAMVDDYSSRYDEPRDLFVVLLFTSVQQPRVGVKDYRIHCHVVPEETMVSYFRDFEIQA